MPPQRAAMPDKRRLPDTKPDAFLNRGCAVRGKRFENAAGLATLGTTAKANLLLRTWCNGCRRHVDVDPGEQAARYGADLPVREWAARLVCSQCGSRAIDFVVAPDIPVADYRQRSHYR